MTDFFSHNLDHQHHFESHNFSFLSHNFDFNVIIFIFNLIILTFISSSRFSIVQLILIRSICYVFCSGRWRNLHLRMFTSTSRWNLLQASFVCQEECVCLLSPIKDNAGKTAQTDSDWRSDSFIETQLTFIFSWMERINSEYKFQVGWLLAARALRWILSVFMYLNTWPRGRNTGKLCREGVTIYF